MTNSMLANPEFESQGKFWSKLAPGWSFWSQQGSASVSLDSGNAHSGSTAQRMDVYGGDKAVLMQTPIYVQTGTQYGLSIWLRSQGNNGPMRVEIAVKRIDNGFAYMSKLVTVPSHWTQYSLSGFTESHPVQLTITTEDGGVLWADDASMVGSAVGNAPALANVAVPGQYFGMHIHQHSDNALPWPVVPVGAWRLWDSDGKIAWAEVAHCPAPAQGVACGAPIQYDWSTLDLRVQQAAERGVEVMMNLGRTPRWASARPDEPSVYGLGQAAEPKDDYAWQDWVRQIATRYKGRIRHWEIWNEPDFNFMSRNNKYYTGTADKLISLQKQAYEILKSIDPNNLVISPGVVNIDYLDYFLANGGGNYTDVVGYHFYGDTAPEAIYNVHARNVRILADRYAHGAPVWNTEQGWLGSPLDTGVQAAYLARTYILGWAGGISRMYFYAWDNPGMAVRATQNDGSSLTPAGVAYAETVNWLLHQQVVNVTIDSNNTWIVDLADPTGARGNSHIVWNPSGWSTNYTIPTTWSVYQQRNLFGQVSGAWPGMNATINSSPIIFTNHGL